MVICKFLLLCFFGEPKSPYKSSTYAQMNSTLSDFFQIQIAYLYATDWPSLGDSKAFSFSWKGTDFRRSRGSTSDLDSV